MSGIFFCSTGGIFVKRVSVCCPGTETTIRLSLRLLRDTKVWSDFVIIAVASASPSGKDRFVFDDIEGQQLRAVSRRAGV